MFALVAALALAQPEMLPMPEPYAEPAYFEINVEGRTPYTLYLNGKRIKAGETYKTEPLTELVCVEIEIRYVSGGEVKISKYFIDLDPGYQTTYTITLYARPEIAWC